jgi:hypothetical protein
MFGRILVVGFAELKGIRENCYESSALKTGAVDRICKFGLDLSKSAATDLNSASEKPRGEILQRRQRPGKDCKQCGRKGYLNLLCSRKSTRDWKV